MSNPTNDVDVLMLAASGCFFGAAIGFTLCGTLARKAKESGPFIGFLLPFAGGAFGLLVGIMINGCRV